MGDEENNPTCAKNANSSAITLLTELNVPIFERSVYGYRDSIMIVVNIMTTQVTFECYLYSATVRNHPTVGS